MKRILLMVLRNLIRLPGLLIKLWKYSSNVDKYTDEERNKFLKYIVHIANKGGNVKIESYGVENIPNENGFMLFPNHQGMYDVLALLDACPKPLSVVAKKEVAKIPLLKQLFKIMNVIFMDREDVRQSMQVIIEVSKQVTQGRNYIIFPEGTRSKNGNRMLPFHGGTFKSATKSKCTILPFALIDSFKVLDHNGVEPVTVQLHYLKPIPYEEYKDMNTTEIAAMVHDRIERKIAEVGAI